MSGWGFKFVIFFYYIDEDNEVKNWREVKKE